MVRVAESKDSMQMGSLYVCVRDVRITGRLADGSEAFSLVPVGSPVIPVQGAAGEEMILIDGATVNFSWSSPAWRATFRPVIEEVADA
jgi:hypothetical protein